MNQRKSYPIIKLYLLVKEQLLLTITPGYLPKFLSEIEVHGGSFGGEWEAQGNEARGAGKISNIFTVFLNFSDRQQYYSDINHEENRT